MASDMALVPSSKVGVQAGKVLLQQSLDDFRSILKDDEKLRLDSSKAKGTPDASSIMALTSEIDQTQASRTSRRIGPRLQPFLTGVQQISGVMDTFAQLHPIALAAWGTVKLTLLLTSNFGSYFEKLAELLNDIGKKAPSYQEFAILYASSDTLQDALCAYYAAIVKLCQQVVKVSRRKGVFQVPRAALMSFEHDFHPLRKQIEDASDEVNIQVRVASSRVQMQEAKLNQLERERSDDSRRLLARFSSQAQAEYMEMKRWRDEQDIRSLRRDKELFREQLSAIDHTLPWRQARKACTPDTAIWFRDEPMYTNWQHANAPDLLWLSGPLGSGKTIVTANIVADLNDMRINASDHCQVAYFFCVNENTASLKSRNIFGSIALQLLDDIISRSDRPKFESLKSSCRTFSDVDTVIAFIASSLETTGQYFIVLDGVDQAGSDLDDILACLDDLIRLTPQSFKIKVLLSTRPGTSANISKVFQSPLSLLMSNPHVEQDLELFVNNTLIEKVDRGELRLTDLDMLEELRDFLVTGSQGMFLWTKLLVEEICMCSTDEEIIASLTALPLKLADIYHRILDKALNSSHSEVILSLLQWVSGTMRPLKRLEILEALTLAPGQKNFQQGKLLHSIKESVLATRGLVFIDEDEETLHLVHHSLKQALVGYTRKDGPSIPSFEQDELNLRLGQLCMTYLLFEDFNRQIAKTSANVASLDVSNLALQLSESTKMSKGMTKTAMSILQKGRNRDSKVANSSSRSFDIERKLRDMAENMSKTRRNHSGHGECQHLLGYAASAWIDHTKTISASSVAWTFFERVVESRDEHIIRPWEKCLDLTWHERIIRPLGTNPSKLHANIMEWAARHAHHGLVELSFLKAYIGKVSMIEAQSPSFWLSAERREFERAIFLTIMKSKERSIHILAYQLMDNPVFDARFRSLLAVVFDFSVTDPTESSASYVGGVLSRGVWGMSNNAYSIKDLIHDFELAMLEQKFHQVQQFATKQLQSDFLLGTSLEWSNMVKPSGLELAGERLALDQSLSSIDLAIIFDREQIYTTLFESFEAHSALEEHLGVALVYGQKSMAERILAEALLQSSVDFRFKYSLVGLSMIQGFSSLAITMVQRLPQNLNLQEFGDLSRLAWTKKMPEVFRSLLDAAKAVDIVLNTLIDPMHGQKAFEALQSSSLSNVQKNHESLRDYIMRLESFRDHIMRPKSDDTDQQQMKEMLMMWETKIYEKSPEAVILFVHGVMGENLKSVQDALSKSTKPQISGDTQHVAIWKYWRIFHICIAIAEELLSSHGLADYEALSELRQMLERFSIVMGRTTNSTRDRPTRDETGKFVTNSYRAFTKLVNIIVDDLKIGQSATVKTKKWDKV